MNLLVGEFVAIFCHELKIFQRNIFVFTQLFEGAEGAVVWRGFSVLPNRRVQDKIIEKSNADLLIKLINQAGNLTEAIAIAELGTSRLSLVMALS